jgi:CheY-like chemotaxis protein
VDEACRALRVLVADDYPEARLALIDLLNFAGIDNVDAVSRGAEVLACLEAARNDGLPYDLLFLDGSLPTGTEEKYWIACVSSPICRPAMSPSCRCPGPSR